eukprot:1157606-Pelagomonas_calceolata.AAC.2
MSSYTPDLKQIQILVHKRKMLVRQQCYLAELVFMVRCSAASDAVCEALSLEASSSAEVSVEVLDQAGFVGKPCSMTISSEREDPPQSMEKQVLSSKLDMGVNFVHGNTLNLKPHTTPHMAYSQSETVGTCTAKLGQSCLTIGLNWRL